MMLAIFEQVFILVVFCLVGYVLSKTGWIDATHSKTLSILLVYIFYPCVLFNSFSARFTPYYLVEKAPLFLVSLGIIPVVVITAKVINRFLSKEPFEKRVNEYSMSMANIGYMGYPLAEAIFGGSVLLDCMIFALPMNVYIGTVGYNMLTAGEKKKTLLQQIITPSMVGILLGCFVGITGIRLPSVVCEITQKSAACMAPISMLLTGMTISQFSIKEMLLNKKVYIISGVRLMLAPLLVFGLLKLFCLEFALTAGVLLYAMPCGMNTIVYPQLVGKDCRLGAATVLVSTILSLITIPLCLHFLLGQ